MTITVNTFFNFRQSPQSSGKTYCEIYCKNRDEKIIIFNFYCQTSEAVHILHNAFMKASKEYFPHLTNYEFIYIDSSFEERAKILKHYILGYLDASDFYKINYGIEDV